MALYRCCLLLKYWFAGSVMSMVVFGLLAVPIWLLFGRDFMLDVFAKSCWLACAIGLTYLIAYAIWQAKGGKRNDG